MPESLMGKTNPESPTPREAAKAAASTRPHRGFFSTDPNEDAGFAAATGAPSESDGAQSGRWIESDRPWLRINWEIKALVPIASVLLGGMLLFLLATFSWRDPERHLVLLVAGAGAVAICGALLVVLTYQIQRPLLELQKRIAQLGQGNLEVAVSFARRNDEIGDLGRNFNHMVEQLRESRREIERLHRTQMSRAEHLATLGELATGLAHEIRNPLAGIAGVIEIVGRDLPQSSPAHAVVNDVRQEIARINHIVTDLLQTARPHRPEMKNSNLNTTVEHAVMLGRQQASAKAIDIVLTKDDALRDVEHDSDQIHQLLLNLLLNATQAIDARGTVAVTLKHEWGFAIIQIADTGRGIAPEHLPNIFRPFYTTKGDGTGLGLSLARRIVEDHRGKLEVSSVVGRGTTFSIKLPLRQPAKLDDTLVNGMSAD